MKSILFVFVAVFFLLINAPIAEAHHKTYPEAGFKRAIYPNRMSIRVQYSSTNDIDEKAVIAAWNRAAGWRLFRLSNYKPHVTFVKDRTIPVAHAWLQPSWTKRGYYTHCTIFYRARRTPVIQHELGHCLGFPDHVRYESPWPPKNPDGSLKYFKPRNCDRPDKPGYSSYYGVISHCAASLDRWFIYQDRKMLYNAGYRTAKP